VNVTLRDQGEANGAHLYFMDDRSAERDLGSVFWHLANFDDVDFADFSFILNSMPKLFCRRIRSKRTLYCSLRITNEDLNAGLAINQVAFIYAPEKPKIR